LGRISGTTFTSDMTLSRRAIVVAAPIVAGAPGLFE